MQAAYLFRPVGLFGKRSSSLEQDAWIKLKAPSFRLGVIREIQNSNLNIFLRPTRLSAIHNAEDGKTCLSVAEDHTNTSQTLPKKEDTWVSNWSPPKYLSRALSVFILAGLVISRTLMGKVHWRNTLQQLERVGPKSVGVCLLTASFVGLAFGIQFVREFTRLGLNRSIGGVLALAFARELSPVITSIIIAGRIGSACICCRARNHASL